MHATEITQGSSQDQNTKDAKCLPYFILETKNCTIISKHYTYLIKIIYIEFIQILMIHFKYEFVHSLCIVFLIKIIIQCSKRPIITQLMMIIFLQ